MYEELIKALRCYAKDEECYHCEYFSKAGCDIDRMLFDAADAIEERCQQVDKFMEEAARLYTKQPKWIPVTDRCPEKSGDYLVFDDCRNLYVNEWHCLLKKWQYDDSRITHWQPLPEPPKEE